MSFDLEWKQALSCSLDPYAIVKDKSWSALLSSVFDPYEYHMIYVMISVWPAVWLSTCSPWCGQKFNV